MLWHREFAHVYIFATPGKDFWQNAYLPKTSWIIIITDGISQINITIRTYFSLIQPNKP